MRAGMRVGGWGRPVAGLIAVGGLAALPALTGCADTASAAPARLERFTSCAALNEYAQAHALDAVGPYGLVGGFGPGASLASEDAMAQAGGAAREVLPAAAPKVGGTDFSTTNVQEAGVDEPDIVKTDGNRIFAIARNRLYAIDASGPAPRIAGSLEMPRQAAAREMLISGDRLLVMADGPVTVRPQARTETDGGTPEAPRIASPAIAAFGGSLLIEVDVTDPAAMKIAETMETEARYVTARMSGATARVVVVSGSPTGIAFTSPTEPGALPEAAALRANRNALARTTSDDWLPRYAIRSALGTTGPRPLVACEAVSRPREFAGLGALTVLTIDLTRGLEPIDRDAVMAGGENVYASPQALYVATNRWQTPDATGKARFEDTTQIHKFDTTSPSRTTYGGSGVVKGHLLNQFSMSELDGRLRVATTDERNGLVGGDAIVEGQGESESYVTVLQDGGDRLHQIGQVGGLGKGERIYAVRFIGTTGYVVTFKQTDPLYTIDLSDPAAPRVAGELEIAGYSAYLHPIGDNLLIGVGQDANDQGRVRGLQVSLFDVSDPAAPRRIQHTVLPGASSEAEWDHHAFVWWPARSLAVIPFMQPWAAPAPVPSEGPTVDVAPVALTAGALGLRVARDGITEAGRIAHPSDPQYYGAGIRRTLVIGDALYTVSDAGIEASALDGFAERAWLAFA